MLLHLPRLLDRQQVRTLLDIAERNPYQDGRETAGERLKEVKHVDQLRPSPQDTRTIQNIVMGALGARNEFEDFAFPKGMLIPRISRYGEGMGYGAHFDSFVMGSEHPIRTDLSMTLYLSEPGDYDGGELVLETPYGEEEIKLPAGDAVVYATTVKHRVDTVTRGARVVILTWFQSLIRDPVQRDLLHELTLARKEVRDKLPDSDAAASLLKLNNALLRAWGET
ncbi:MAG: Fe2+-dependent dioxygenase [Gammaproteobacteria bacterium]|nr:Fe2+-dependent dioxygenase [Gammaproteobacteria bacterium]